MASENKTLICVTQQPILARKQLKCLGKYFGSHGIATEDLPSGYHVILGEVSHHYMDSLLAGLRNEKTPRIVWFEQDENHDHDVKWELEGYGLTYETHNGTTKLRRRKPQVAREAFAGAATQMFETAMLNADNMLKEISRMLGDLREPSEGKGNATWGEAGAVCQVADKLQEIHHYLKSVLRDTERAPYIEPRTREDTESETLETRFGKQESRLDRAEESIRVCKRTLKGLISDSENHG